MSYHRVLPRDLFNESKLLKCLGRLTILIEDGLIPELKLEYDGRPFCIEQQSCDGSTYCTNIKIYLFQDGELKQLDFVSALNSRESYPLLCEYQGEAFEVFNDDGSLHDSFLENVLERPWFNCIF